MAPKVFKPTAPFLRIPSFSCIQMSLFVSIKSFMVRYAAISGEYMNPLCLYRQVFFPLAVIWVFFNARYDKNLKFLPSNFITTQIGVGGDDRNISGQSESFFKNTGKISVDIFLKIRDAFFMRKIESNETVHQTRKKEKVNVKNEIVHGVLLIKKLQFDFSLIFYLF